MSTGGAQCTTWPDVAEAWAAIGWLHPWLVEHEDAWQQVLVDAAGSDDPSVALQAVAGAVHSDAPASTVRAVREPTTVPTQTIDALAGSHHAPAVVDARGSSTLAPLWDWLCGEQPPVAGLRSVLRVGWSSEPQDSAYMSGHVVTAARGSTTGDVIPLVVIVDSDLQEHDLAVLGALRLAGAVAVVAAADVARTMTAAGIRFRVTEVVDDLGRPVFLPDRLASGEAAVDEAHDLLENWPPRPPRLLTWDPPPSRPVSETFPERLTAVARLFQILRYAYGYPHLIEGSLSELLRQALTTAQVERADAQSEALLVLIRALRDQHCNLWPASVEKSPYCRQGPITVLDVEGEVVVCNVTDETAGIDVGDIVHAVDGVPIAECRRRAATWRSSSTNTGAALVSARNSVRCASETITYELLGADGELRTMTASTVGWIEDPPPSSLPTWTVMEGNAGYIDLTRLAKKDVTEAFEAVRHTERLIVDLRGYPQGTGWMLAGLLAHQPIVAAEFRIRQCRPEESLAVTTYTVESTIAEPYAGLVFVLIDARAISQSEHTCLLLAAAPNVTFIGSTTAGANGETRALRLRNNDEIYVTPMDVRHGDGRQLQGVGIVPDVWVTPSIRGIRERRDEVLDCALAYSMASRR